MFKPKLAKYCMYCRKNHYSYRQIKNPVNFEMPKKRQKLSSAEQTNKTLKKPKHYFSLRYKCFLENFMTIKSYAKQHKDEKIIAHN